MDRVKVERWHAYLTEDGEIFICEYLSPKMTIWSSTISRKLLKGKYCKSIKAFELGYVGSQNFERRKVQLTTYRRSYA